MYMYIYNKLQNTVPNNNPYFHSEMVKRKAGHRKEPTWRQHGKMVPSE